MGFISIPVVLLALYVIVSLRVLRQYERGVVFLLGRFAGVRGPGLTLIFVPIQQMVRVSLRTVTMQIPSQKIITRDNVSIDIAAVAYYHITDPERAVIAIENVYNAINQISQTTVRNVVGRFNLDELLADTASINDQIKNVIDIHTEPWGTQGDGGRDQGHHAAGQHAARDGQGGRGRARAPRQDRRCRRRISGGGKARPGGRYHHPTSGGTAAAHSADHGGDLDREEFHHHFPGAVHDHRTGGDRAAFKRFDVEITRVEAALVVPSTPPHAMGWEKGAPPQPVA
jgi:hypothetical protein